MAVSAASKTFMLIGQCVPCLKHNASKIKVKRLELDQNLLMVMPLFLYIKVMLIHVVCNFFSISKKMNLFTPLIQRRNVNLAILY